MIRPSAALLSCALLLAAMTGLAAGISQGGEQTEEVAADSGKSSKKKSKKAKKRKKEQAAQSQPESGSVQKPPEKKSKKTKFSSKKKKKKEPEWKFSFKDRPELNHKKNFTMEFTARVQLDFRDYVPNVPTEGGMFVWRRMRVGIQGALFKKLEYEIERELRPTAHPWRDFFANYKIYKSLEVRGGRFKIPFGRDQIKPLAAQDFVYRSLLGSNLASGRDTGLMISGELLRGTLQAHGGIFRGDGDIPSGRFQENSPDPAVVETSGGATFAGRLLVSPLRRTSVPEALRHVQIGAAFTRSNLAAGLRSIRAQGITGDTFFPRLYVEGSRTRFGTDFGWRHGPLGLGAEYAQTRDTRRHQGANGQDLPDLLGRSWWVAGTWMLTGEKKANHIVPRETLIPWRGAGAWELAVRMEQLCFVGADRSANPSRGSRAQVIQGNCNRANTAGINWYWNRWIKIQANVVQESFTDLVRSPIRGERRIYTWVARVQFLM